MQTIQTIVQALVTTSLLTQQFALGARLPLRPLIEKLGDYDLVWRAVLSNIVLVPLLALGLFQASRLVLAIALPLDVVVGFLLAAFAAGGLFTPRAAEAAGGDILTAVVATTLLALLSVFTTPVTAFLALPEGTGEVVPLGQLVWQFGLILIVPVALGQLARRYAGDSVLRLIPPLGLASIATLVVALIVILTQIELVARLGTGVLLVSAILVAAAIGLGWWLGGAAVGPRKSLALETGQKNIALALFIAESVYPGTGAGLGVASFTLVMIALTPLAVWLLARVPSGSQ